MLEAPREKLPFQHSSEESFRVRVSLSLRFKVLQQSSFFVAHSWEVKMAETPSHEPNPIVFFDITLGGKIFLFLSLLKVHIDPFLSLSPFSISNLH